MEGLAAAAHKSGLQAFISKTSMPELVRVKPQVDTSAGPAQLGVQRKKNWRFGYHPGAQGKAIVPGIAGANAKSKLFWTRDPSTKKGALHELAGSGYTPVTGMLYEPVSAVAGSVQLVRW